MVKIVATLEALKQHLKRRSRQNEIKQYSVSYCSVYQNQLKDKGLKEDLHMTFYQKGIKVRKQQYVSCSFQSQFSADTLRCLTSCCWWVWSWGWGCPAGRSSPRSWSGTGTGWWPRCPAETSSRSPRSCCPRALPLQQSRGRAGSCRWYWRDKWSPSVLRASNNGRFSDRNKLYIGIWGHQLWM